jgi:hypothetical protein
MARVRGDAGAAVDLGVLAGRFIRRSPFLARVVTILDLGILTRWVVSLVT